MTAVSLNFTVLLFALGVTGLGKKLIQWLPAALKSGIILGAAIAALAVFTRIASNRAKPARATTSPDKTREAMPGYQARALAE